LSDVQSALMKQLVVVHEVEGVVQCVIPMLTKRALKGTLEGQCQELRTGTRKVGRCAVVGKWRVEKQRRELGRGKEVAKDWPPQNGGLDPSALYDVDPTHAQEETGIACLGEIDVPIVGKSILVSRTRAQRR